MPILFRASMTLCLVLVTACTSVPAPATYPADQSIANAIPLVAVMHLRRGGDLPEFEECKAPDVICLHAPFWLRGEVIAPLYGTPRTRHMAVTSAGHYGTSWYENQHDPWLVVLLDNGKDVVMPTYASERLVRRDDGTLFMIVEHEGQPAFLPCPIAGLREEIDQAHFPRRLRVPADDYSVKQSPQLYNVANGTAFPRYGIAVSRIGDALVSLHPSANEMRCPETES